MGLPSVGVGGIAGGGIAAESSAEDATGGDIASGVATGREEKYCVFSFCEADAGPVEVLDALLEIFNVNFFGASILSLVPGPSPQLKISAGVGLLVGHVS